MCTLKYVNFKRCEHKSMWSSKRQDVRAYDGQSKYTCEHEINKESEHTSSWAFKPQNKNTSYCLITLGFKHNHQSMYVPEHTCFVSKRIDISSIKCVHMWLKNKSYEGVTFNLYVAFKHGRIQAFDYESIQSCDH